MIRKAKSEDIKAIAKIYDDILSQEEDGNMTIGWIRDVYPTESTARAALERDDLFVYEEDGKILAAAIINHTQVDEYALGKWQCPAEGKQVMVLHTLVVSPSAGKNGVGRKFVAFYEQYAKDNGCIALRMDTNEKNAVARKFYKKLGYAEIGIVPCVFNGIPDVQLVLLEKVIAS